MLIMMAFSMLIGIGANSLVSIRLGENRKEEAEGIFGNAISLLIIISFTISVIGLVFLDPLLKFLGASKQILPYAKDYLQIILFGGVFQAIGMGIVNSILTLMIMPIFGINQGVQPIIGYNYGAKKFDRVKEAYKLAVISATVIIVAGWIVTRLFPGQLVSMFSSKDKELISFGTFAIKRFMRINILFTFKYSNYM